MPLNNIQLNPALLADMYRNSLVEIDEMHETKENILKSPGKDQQAEKNNPVAMLWNYLGDFKKNILLVVRYTEVVHLPDKQLNFIISFLTPCKLNLADIAILNIAKAPSFIYKDVQDHFNSKVIVLFGLTPAEFAMPVNFPEFQVQAINNCTFLTTPALEELEKDKVLKSKLWVCLRRVFSLP